jgi:hypothetical protein
LNVEEILAGIEIYDGEYKREHIDAALNQQEEITPHLIAILEQVRDNPEKYAEGSDYHAHIYALMLLGHWRETKAHQPIVDIAQLPEPLPEDLLGDIITEDLPVILLRTCGGSLDRIKELTCDKNAYDFSRGAAITAITYAVVEGLITREDVLSFFGELLIPDQALQGSCFYDQLACAICDLYPEELMNQVQEAYKQDLIDPVFVGIENFQKALKDGKEKCLDGLRQRLSAHYLDDFHQTMGEWACFNEKSEKPATPKPNPPKVPNFSYQSEPKQKKKKAFWEL